MFSSKDHQESMSVVTTGCTPDFACPTNLVIFPVFVVVRRFGPFLSGVDRLKKRVVVHISLRNGAPDGVALQGGDVGMSKQ